MSSYGSDFQIGYTRILHIKSFPAEWAGKVTVEHSRLPVHKDFADAVGTSWVAGSVIFRINFLHVTTCSDEGVIGHWNNGEAIHGSDIRKFHLDESKLDTRLTRAGFNTLRVQVMHVHCAFATNS